MSCVGIQRFLVVKFQYKQILTFQFDMIKKNLCCTVDITKMILKLK